MPASRSTSSISYAAVIWVATQRSTLHEYRRIRDSYHHSRVLREKPIILQRILDIILQNNFAHSFLLTFTPSVKQDANFIVVFISMH